ncbi:hypothetical protein BKA65DRAFT_475233 [Rhexocercosporidium sp. MPI-PUGE-AT-0058]|nr:hypothetical protein BKA65DRAFT_475233 [Rhexocercosporidium sp. MPI-PUGE-AT-0058]
MLTFNTSKRRSAKSVDPEGDELQGNLNQALKEYYKVVYANLPDAAGNRTEAQNARIEAAALTVEELSVPINQYFRSSKNMQRCREVELGKRNLLWGILIGIVVATLWIIFANEAMN